MPHSVIINCLRHFSFFLLLFFSSFAYSDWSADPAKPELTSSSPNGACVLYVADVNATYGSSYLLSTVTYLTDIRYMCQITYDDGNNALTRDVTAVGDPNCPDGSPPNQSDGTCLLLCIAGEVDTLSTSSMLNFPLCSGGCEYTGGNGRCASDGSCLFTATSNGNTCLIDDALGGGDTPPIDGTGPCAPGFVCFPSDVPPPFPMPPDDCGSFNGRILCKNDLDPPGDSCGKINDITVCANDSKNCGYFNGEMICVQPVPGQPLGDQNTPGGKTVLLGGQSLTINNSPVTNTTTLTIVNADGSTTTTTTVTDNILGSNPSTTTTQTSPDGSTETTIEEGDPAPDNAPPSNIDSGSGSIDSLLDGTGIGDFITGIGSEISPDSSSVTGSMPFSVVSSSSCQTINLNWMGTSFNFPSSAGCQNFEKFKNIFGWVLYILTFFTLVDIALLTNKRP